MPTLRWWALADEQGETGAREFTQLVSSVDRTRPIPIQNVVILSASFFDVHLAFFVTTGTVADRLRIVLQVARLCILNTWKYAKFHI
jgi:hypothetical protein